MSSARRETFQDDQLPISRHCYLCGRIFDLNEVKLGVYTDYFLLHRDECSCPTCFGHQLHRVQTDGDVFVFRHYSELAPNDLIKRASRWSFRSESIRPPDRKN